MKVLIWPAGDTNDGVSMYRQYLPGHALERQGADVKVDMAGPSMLWDTDWSGMEFPPPSARIMGLARRPDADVVVMQRNTARRWWADSIPFLQKEGIRCVVDVDDLFSDIHRSNAARRELSPRANRVKNKEWLDEACRRADVVTCTTPALRERYGYGHGVVLPNMVPEEYLTIDVVPRRDTAGWTGTVQTHPTDLTVTHGQVGEALGEADWHFHVVGTGEGVQEALGLREPVSYTGWVPFANYAWAMAEIGLGVVPLDDTPFNRAKSCLKMMEFASLGVPVIATATPDNLRLYKMGVGNVVNHPSQWYRRLRKMVGSEEYRKDLAGRGRAVMAQNTYEKKCHLWARAWGIGR